MPRVAVQVVAWMTIVVQLVFGLMPAGLVLCFDRPRQESHECASIDQLEAGDSCCKPDEPSIPGFPVLMDHECPPGCHCCTDIRVPTSVAVVNAAIDLNPILVSALPPVADVVFDLCLVFGATRERHAPWPPIPKRAEIRLAIARGLDSTLLLI